MVRLIVEDGGSRRAFNVGEGRLSMGSGPEAKLKLSAAGVAGIHADIEVHGGKATLHPKPGVTAPHVLGRAMNGPVVLQHGVPVKIGAAQVIVEYEGHPAATAAPVISKAERGSARSHARGKQREEEEQQGGARRGRSQGTPTWVWIAIGVPAVILAGWLTKTFFFGKLLQGDGRSFATASAPAYYQNARDRLANAQYDLARMEIERIPKDAQLDPQFAAQVAQLRQQIEAKIAEGEEYSRNAVAGKKYFDSQLKGFVERYMTGTISSQEARVFLKRAKYFREKWPTHPELEWVTRQEARFTSAIDLSKPPTFEDIQFEVESLTWSFPRNYAEAFAVSRAFLASAQGEDVAKATAFIAELESKRTAWFKDRLEEARFLFDGKEFGKSIGVLLSIIRYAGDERMQDDAAQRLMNYQGIEEWLRGYRTADPEGFEAVCNNRVVAAYLKEHKL